MLFEEENLFSKWRPGGCCFGQRVVVMLQSSRSGRDGGEVLGRPEPVARPCESFGTRMLPHCCAGPLGRVEPVARPCESFGTRMLPHCCAGPLGRVVAGNILSEVTALSGRAEPRWMHAGGRQVPSESVARRSRHVRRFELRVGPMCRADCGQWWPAKLCVQPGRPKSVFAPQGALRVAMSGLMGRAIARAEGF
jgi:hypothetical protein